MNTTQQLLEHRLRCFTGALTLRLTCLLRMDAPKGTVTRPRPLSLPFRCRKARNLQLNFPVQLDIAENSRPKVPASVASHPPPLPSRRSF